VKLPQLCIQLHGVANTRLALDPFMDIGHAGLACAKLGVAFVGFEIDADYFAEAKERLTQALKS
jgi:site-specific DNA-methyltransferase (adenine-specific)